MSRADLASGLSGLWRLMGRLPESGEGSVNATEEEASFSFNSLRSPWNLESRI